MSEYKIIVLGSGGVGKSALTLQFVQGIFVERYDPTIEDCYKKNVNLDGEVHMLEIMDTAGTEQFTSLRDIYMKTGDAFVIVYSISSMSTFNDVQPLIEQINLIKESSDAPIVIVGNKCDLEDEREVSNSLGKELARKLNCNFIEASAKLKINVNEIFLDIVRQIARQRKKTPRTAPQKQSNDTSYYIGTDSPNSPNMQPKDSFKQKCSRCCTETCSIL